MRGNEKCGAASSDGTVCDRPVKHYGSHDGPITVSPRLGLNVWTWPAKAVKE